MWKLIFSAFSTQVPEGKVVVLSFRFIDLENDNLCRYDYVDVYSGHVNGQRLGRFCGTFKPGSLVSMGNKMLLQMVSDANTAGSGFLAVFSAAHPHERGRETGVVGKVVLALFFSKLMSSICSRCQGCKGSSCVENVLPLPKCVIQKHVGLWWSYDFGCLGRGSGFKKQINKLMYITAWSLHVNTTA